ncbi:uncharacterized protein [Nicotiana sylvestris]|uniref:uncharacterized protein n=1 Tax=Nicotiana sylvestris TaxID=4096 RepID=UPI00388C984D
MTKFFCSLEINQKVEFIAVRSCSKRYELKCIVDKCGWNVRATRIKNFTLFRVIKYHNIHKCSVDARKSDQKHATSNFISEQIIEHVRDKKIEVTPAFVENEMKKKYGIDIGTYTSIKRDSQNRFAYMFFAPAVSVASWSYCRPVIAVDATFLKSKYHGVLFFAISKDTNNQIFPLYFGVAESENNEAYIWFFGKMRKAIQVRRELVFLSDRNQLIANENRKVFPEAHHDICLYHFVKNLKQRHAKVTVINLFQSAARSYKRENFNQLMSQLKSIDKKTYNYIMEEPPERWARSWFPRRSYDMLTTNMAESMNSVLLKGREMPILRMLDFIQEKLGEWFYERRKKANETFHRVSIWAEEEMTKKMDLACKIEGIKFIVDLKKRTCDCLEFQLDELPCPHAIAAINKRYLQKSDYCSNLYSKKTWLKTYEGYVNTMGDQKLWDIPQNVQFEITKPPDLEILQGRRQKKRHIPVTESVPFKSTKCSRCKQVGYNRTTCLSFLAPHPYSKKHTEKYSNLQ